jgi:hypothetical protein
MTARSGYAARAAIGGCSKPINQEIDVTDDSLTPTTHRVIRLLRKSETPLTASQIAAALGIPARAIRRALEAKAVTAACDYRRTRLTNTPNVYWGREHLWESVTTIPLVGVQQRQLTAARPCSAGQKRGQIAGGEAAQDMLLFAGRERYPTNKQTLEDRHRPFTSRESERLARWAMTFPETS